MDTKKPFKVPDKPTVYFDVDDTLVMWHGNVVKPKSSEGTVTLKDPRDGSTLFLKVHDEHVEMLKGHKMRGHSVVVWSAGGADWAEYVIKELKLESYVDVIMSKPNWWYDDLLAKEILFPHSRKYINYVPKGCRPGAKNNED